MPGAFGDYPTRVTTSPFYSGYRAGLKFDDIFMQADSWSAEIKDDPIELNTVKIYRDSNIDEALSVDYPLWYVNGTPATYVKGGIRDTSFKVHGFHKDALNLPTFGKIAVLTLFVGGVEFFRCERAIVVAASYNVSVKGAVEFQFDLKASATSTTIDTDALPRF
jgi:hypothetical protein